MRILGDGEVGGKNGADRHGGEDGAAFLKVEGVGLAEDEGKGGKG